MNIELLLHLKLLFYHVNIISIIYDRLVFDIHYVRCSLRAFKNCRCRRCFTSSRRGIGKSFQLAIITPRETLIGYDIATAQSWFQYTKIGSI